MVAEHLPESPVKDVGSSMVATNRRPTIAVDTRPNLLASLDNAVKSLDVVNMKGVEGQSGIEDPEESGLRGDGPCVADLAASFSVERSPIEHHGPVTNMKYEGIGLFVLMPDEMSKPV